MQITNESAGWRQEGPPRSASWRGLRWQMDVVLHGQITARRDDAPHRIFLARDLKGGASRFGSEILDVAPIAVVIFRMRRHRNTDWDTGAPNSHFDGEARQIRRVNLNSVGNAWVQFVT